MWLLKLSVSKRRDLRSWNNFIWCWIEFKEFRLERVNVNEDSEEIMHNALKDEGPMSQDMSVMAKCEG